jgi:hypothetical protein
MTERVITHLGAVPDGRTCCTQIINCAISELAEGGGGRLVIPRGTFITGTVVLRSYVSLVLEEGAVLLGSDDIEDYLPRIWGHHQDITPWHLVLAEDCTNVSIVGPGTIRGNGPTFWESERPSEWHFFKPKMVRPSPMVEIVRCAHVLVEGVRLEESAGWTLHLHDCDHARISGVTVRNSFFGPNTDGVDLTGCQDVLVTGCDIATGDDAIALKTSDYSRACERIAISDCILRTSCVGVRIGYESRQDLRDIVISNLVIPRCSRGFDLRAIEGATIERVRVTNCIVHTDSGWTVNRPIEITAADRPNVYKKALPSEHPDFGKDKPILRPSRVRDVSFNGLDIVTDGRITVVGKPGEKVENVRFSDIRISFVWLDDAGPLSSHPGSPSFLPGDMAEARGANAAFVVQNATDIEIDGLRVRWPEYPVGPLSVFDSPHRSGSAFLYGHEREVQSGERRVHFSVLWARNAEVSVRGKHLVAEGGDYSAYQLDARSSVTWSEL